MHNVDKLLILYGKGDHGGGPMPDMMDRAVDADARPQLPHRPLQQSAGLLP